MLEALVKIDWSKVITPLITAVVSGGAMWVWSASRKVAKNYGKTEVEIDEADLAEAEKAVELAKIAAEKAKVTSDPGDDAEATALTEQAGLMVEKAKRKLNNAKRWQAVLDAVADTDASERK